MSRSDLESEDFPLIYVMRKVLVSHGQEVHVDVLVRMCVGPLLALEESNLTSRIRRLAIAVPEWFTINDHDVVGATQAARAVQPGSSDAYGLPEIARAHIVEVVNESTETVKRIRKYTQRELERVFPPAHRGSARNRIKGYLIATAGTWISGDEIEEVAGSSEWARRVRELRQQGMGIDEKDGNYRLSSGSGEDNGSAVHPMS